MNKNKQKEEEQQSTQRDGVKLCPYGFVRIHRPAREILIPRGHRESQSPLQSQGTKARVTTRLKSEQ